MAARTGVTTPRILSAVQKKAAQHRRQTDRQIAQILRCAIWIRDGRGGAAPLCESGMISLAEEYATLYPDLLSECARALGLKGYVESAEACRLLRDFAAVQTLH